MTINGRRKGARAELQVAALCEEWWQQLEPGCKFRRTPGSGGSGGKADADVRAHFKVGGDLMTTAKQWPFCVDLLYLCKYGLPKFAFWENQRCCNGSDNDLQSKPREGRRAFLGQSQEDPPVLDLDGGRGRREWLWNRLGRVQDDPSSSFGVEDGGQRSARRQGSVPQVRRQTVRAPFAYVRRNSRREHARCAGEGASGAEAQGGKCPRDLRAPRQRRIAQRLSARIWSLDRDGLEHRSRSPMASRDGGSR